MSHSDSTLLANSILTDCGNSASDCESVVSATCKRKMDCDSGTLLPLAVNPTLIFHHIVMARHNKPPYRGLTWNDEMLWSIIARASGSSLLEVVECVTCYGKLHRQDQSLLNLTDEFLGTNVRFAFEDNSCGDSKGPVDLQDLYSVKKAIEANQPLPKHDVRPHPHLYYESSSSEGVVGYASGRSGLERVIRNCRSKQKEQEKMEERKKEQGQEEGQRQNKLVLLPCTSNQSSYSAMEKEIGYKISKEYGYRSALTSQYSEDMSGLNLNLVEKCNLILNFGPSSNEYMVMFHQPQEERLKMLRFLLNGIPIGSDHSNNSSNSLGSSRKKRKWQFL